MIPPETAIPGSKEFASQIIQQLEDGAYGVVGGRSRCAAMIMLAADKSAKGFTKTMKIACREAPAEDAANSSVSYSENALQMPMDMLGCYEFFGHAADRTGYGSRGRSGQWVQPEAPTRGCASTVGTHRSFERQPALAQVTGLFHRDPPVPALVFLTAEPRD